MRIFGFWLPFIGWRTRELNAMDAWELDQERAGTFHMFELEWFGFGLLIGYRREATDVLP